MEDNNIKISRVKSDNEGFQNLIKELNKDLWSSAYDDQKTYDSFNYIDENAKVVVAFLENKPIACGCFKMIDSDKVEIKRMYVVPDMRRRGLSKMILNQLRGWAKELDYQFMRLETGTKQYEAISLYENYGFKQIPKFDPYTNMPDSVCFEMKI